MNERIVKDEKMVSMPGEVGYSTVTTQVVKAKDPEATAIAARAIEQGELVVLPTDTVYGVGATAFNEDAVRRLYAIKRRPKEKGIPILIAAMPDLNKIAVSIPPVAEDLMARFWPGPLTIILPKRGDLPSSISATDGVAVRMPDHQVCREIIRAAGGALATSSANLSGKNPAISVEMALLDLAGLVAVAVDSGPSAGQVASTVVDCTSDEVRVLRAGPLALEDLVRVESF